MEKVRFGLVGCGFIGLTHAWALSTSEKTELVAVADIDEKRAKEMGERFGVPYYTSQERLLNREDVDAIGNATPSSLHPGMAIEAAQAGKHVIVEKPIGTLLKEVDEAIEICKKRGVKFASIFQMRFSDASQKIKKAAEEGRFGRFMLGGAYVKWYRVQEYYDNWRGTWEYDGGGALINQSIHTIDLLQWIMGPVKKVRGFTATRIHKMETEDVGAGLLEFENGACGIIEGTTAAYPGLYQRLEINGDKGCAVLENKALKTWRFTEEKKGDPQEEEVPDGSLIGAGPNVGVDYEGRDPSKSGIDHRYQYEDFADAIRENREPFVSGVDARKALEIILAIYQSVNEGKEVSLPL